MLNGMPPHGLYPDEVFPAVDSYADLAAADLNHDGALDIVTAGGGTGGSSISISLGNGHGTFDALNKYSVGSAPEALAVGDLNGDTHPDVVVANYLSKSISVLLGHGDGTLAAQVTYDTGGKPRSLAVADLDRDGAADVVVASVEASSGPYYRLSVFRGQGDGSFATPIDYALTRSPTELAAADVNGDLYPDVVLTQYEDYDSSVLAVFLNQGNGTLGTAAETVVAGWLSDVVVGDLNGDGDADLVLGNVKDQTFGVRLGQGDGSFPTQVNYPTGLNGAGGLHSERFVLADLNADSQLDLVAATDQENAVDVFLGHGDGTFAPFVQYAEGQLTSAVAVGDFNGDGVPDIARGHYDGVFTSLLFGRGDGSFHATPTYPSGASSGGIASADLNGDRLADVVTVGDAGILSVLLRRADGSFDPAKTYAAQRGNLQLADLNGDGLPDIVTQWNLAVSVLLNHGDGMFADGGVYATTMECAPVLLADFSGDGLPDMAAAHKYDAALELFLGRGDGTFAGAAVQPLVASQAIAAGDLNGDGLTDLMTTQGRGVDVFLGNGDGTFRRGADYLGWHAVDHLGLGDVNADGRLDAVIAHDGWTPTSSDSVLTVLLGQADGTFAVGLPVALDAPPRGMVLADVNGDGATDALVGDENYAEVSVFLGGPDGRLRKHANYRQGGWVAGAAVADADGDGIPDLLTANASSTVTTLRGLGDGSFARTVNYAIGETPLSVALADLDGDGILDLIVGKSKYDYTVSVLPGLGGGKFGGSTNWSVGAAPTIVTAADLDGDGNQDIVTANQQQRTFSVLRGHGDSTFSAPAAYDVAGAPADLAVADLNGDLVPDVVVVSNYGHPSTAGVSPVSVFLGRGDGTFDAETRYPIGGSLTAVAVADVNGDQIPDLAVASQGSDQIAVLVGRGDGTFARQATYDAGADPKSLAVGDLNGDQRPDFVVSHASGLSVLLARADGTFAPAVPYAVANNQVTIADVTGDGRPDVAAAGYGQYTVLTGIGDGTLGARATYRLSAGTLYDLAVADLNGDQSLDVVAATMGYFFGDVSVSLHGAGWQVTHQAGAAPVNTVRIDFARSMDATSFQFPAGVASFTGPQGTVAVTGFQWVNRTTLELAFAPQTKAGTYELVLNAGLRDAGGQAIDLDGDGTGGEAVCDQYHATFAVPAPRVLAHGVTDGPTGPVDALRLTFSTGMDQTSFQPADVVSFVGPGGPVAVNGYQWLGPQTLEIGFPPQTAAGAYRLTLGPQVFDAGSNPLDQDQDLGPGEAADDQYVAGFAIRGPRVIAHTPASPTAGPVSAVRLSFDQPMNQTSFDPAADIVSFTGPGGTVAATGFSWLDSRTLEVRFAARSAAGQYQLVLGPQVLDAEGNALDQDRDGWTGETPDDRYTAPFRISPYVSGTIAHNTIWSGLVTVRGAVTVAAGATLTVQPGTVVKFATSADGYTPGSLTVQGPIQVLGTASQPVVFTSLYDDAAGSDTDGDGGRTAPQAGDWGFLQLASASAASSLDYAEIRYAGGGGFPEAALNIDNCSPRVSHLTVRDSGGRGVQLTNAAAPEISHLTVAGAAGTAVDVRPTSGGRLSNVVVSGVSGTVSTTPAYGVRLWGTTLVDGVQIRDVRGYAMAIAAGSWHKVTHLQIDAATCLRGAAVELGYGKVTTSFTPQADVVWVSNGFQIDTGATVTLLPGTIFKGELPTVLGTLTALGTAAQPIIFTSLGDDTVGGDTNADSAASHPGDYAGGMLSFYEAGASASVLEHVQVRYGGAKAEPPWSVDRPAVMIWSSAPTLSHVTIEHSPTWGLHLTSGAGPVVENLTIRFCRNSGVYIEDDAGALNLNGASISWVDNWPVYLESMLHWWRVTGLQIDAATCPRGNAAYVAAGTLAADFSPQPGMVWQTGAITVAPGATLTLQPGTILKGAGLTIDGWLQAQGTATRAILLTVPEDDTVGGDTNADGGASLPAAGDRNSIIVSGGGAKQTTLDHVQLRYGGVSVNADGKATAEHSEVRFGGVSFTGSQTFRAAFLAKGGQLTVKNSLVQTANDIGLAVLAGGHLTAENVLVANSTFANVFGNDAGSQVALTNNTLDGGDYGVTLDNNAHLARLVNNVVSHHALAGVALMHGASAGTEVRANDVYNPGATFGNYANLHDYTGIAGNISADPKFVDRAHGDFRLAAASPCIDAADGDAAPTWDRTLWPRFDDLGVPNTGTGDPPYADMGSEERVEDSASAIDLVVVPGLIAGPSAASLGQTVTVGWTIRNQGTAPAAGPWHDKVFLAPLATTAETGTLADEVLSGAGITLLPGQELTVSAQIAVPPATMADHYWQVQTNVRQEVFEGQNWTNNLACADTSVAVTMPLAQIGTAVPGSLAAAGDARYYAVPVAGVDELLIVLDDANDQGANEVYVGLDRVPTRTEYEFAGGQRQGADQRVQISAAGYAYAYVLVYGRDVPDAPGAFTLTAALPEFKVHQLTPGSGGNVGDVTVSIAGEGFPDEVLVYLRTAAGETIDAWPVRRVDGANIFATFDLRGAAPGWYDVVVERPVGGAAIKANALEVRTGGGARLETRLVAPSALRTGWFFPLTVEYANTGDVDMPSPVITLSGPEGLVYSLDADLSDPIASVEFVGSSVTGPAGVLQPGDREQITLYSAASVWQGPYNFSLGTHVADPDNPEPIDWNALKADFRQPFITDEDEWNALWDVFAHELGDDWSEVVARLAERVTDEGVVPGTLPLVPDLLLDELSRAMSRGGGLLDTLTLYVESTAPIQDAAGAVAGMDVIFSKTIDGTTFGPDDVTLTGPGGQPVAGLTVARRSDRLYRVSFPPQTVTGSYELTIEAEIADEAGRPLDLNCGSGTAAEPDGRHFAWFALGSPTQGKSLASGPALSPLPLRIVRHAPQDVSDGHGGWQPSVFSRSGVDSLIVEFNQPLEPGTFTPADVGIRNSDAVLWQRPASVAALSNTVYQLNLKQTLTAAGTYEVRVGPNITRRGGVDGVPIDMLDSDLDGQGGEWFQDEYEWTFLLGDNEGPYAVATHPQTSPWPGSLLNQVPATYTVYFNEPLSAASVAKEDFRLLGPQGLSLTPTGVGEIKTGQEPAELIGLQPTFTIPIDARDGDYTLVVGPGITDAPFLTPANAMNQDQDETNGEPEDAYQLTFHVARDGLIVDVTGLADEAGGTIHCALQLWEVMGDRDAVPGVETSGNRPDYLISRANAVAKVASSGVGEVPSPFVANDGRFLFLQDNAGQPISVRDPREKDLQGNETPRQVYLVALAVNEHGFVIDPDTLTTTNHDNDPLWARVYMVNGWIWSQPQAPPDVGLPAGGQQLWARLRHQVIWGPYDVPADHAPVTVGLHNPAIADPQFDILKDLWKAGQFAQSIGAKSLPPIPAEVVPVSTLPDEYNEIQHVIVVPGARLQDHAALFHAFGHAIQARVAGQTIQPVVHQHDQAGLIQETSAKNAFAEGWADAFAHLVANDGARIYERNDFWMGFDGYGYTSNAAAADRAFPVASLTARFDGVNDDFNLGDVVRGGVASIFWDLADSGQRDDDPIYYPNPLIAALQQAVGSGATLTAFHAAYTNLDAASIFIDHGFPAADDGYEPNDKAEDAAQLPDLKGAYKEKGLIVAEPAPGAGDWFVIHVPSYDKPKPQGKYTLRVRVGFDPRYGDLDVVVKLADDTTGRRAVRDVRRGGNSAAAQLTLDSTQEYDVLIGVFGHGATDPAKGGDFHPSYSLEIVPGVPSVPSKPTVHVNVPVVNSFDPNEKVGPAGVGADAFLDPATVMPYTIYFENDPDQATAPAQMVTITDQLDADLDWSAFQFGQIAFGERVVDASGSQTFHFEADTTVSYDDYPVHVVADFDPQSGLVTWQISSYDPLTGQAPHSPLAGFLPPNDAQHRGEGFVTYTIRPKTGLATGAEIRNEASIVFDINPAIVTNETLNTADAGAPSSEVADLPSQLHVTSIPVTWSGDDENGTGSGIAGYDIYVSSDGGPYQRWLANTVAASGQYQGVPGHRYAFYSVATDHVGHLEAVPSQPDAETTVVANPWHNYANPWDVDGINGVQPQDVLILINYINAHSDPALPAPPAVPPPYYDVSDGDGVTALDVLMVINYINSHPTASAEGEAPAAGASDRPESSRRWTEPYDVIFAADDEDVQLGVDDLDSLFNPKGVVLASRRKGSRRS